MVDAGLSLLLKNNEIICYLIKNNEIKDIMKVNKSLKKRRFLLKGSTRKINGQEGGILSFLRLLMTAGLPLMKSAPTALVKIVLLPLGLSVRMSAADAAIENQFMDQEVQH